MTLEEMYIADPENVIQAMHELITDELDPEIRQFIQKAVDARLQELERYRGTEYCPNCNGPRADHGIKGRTIVLGRDCSWAWVPGDGWKKPRLRLADWKCVEMRSI